MGMILLLPFVFFLVVIFASLKPDPRIALMEPSQRRSFRWGLVLMAVPPAVTVPLLMYFVFVTGLDTNLGWQGVAGFLIPTAVALVCHNSGFRWTRRALASVPVASKPRPSSVGVDELA